jgi:hypothetical protein
VEVPHRSFPFQMHGGCVLSSMDSTHCCSNETYVMTSIILLDLQIRISVAEFAWHGRLIIQQVRPVISLQKI